MLTEQRDEIATALDALIEAIEHNSQDAVTLVGKLTRLRDAAGRGDTLTETVAIEEAPGTMALLGLVLSRLMEASGIARRSLASALRAEGQSVPAIARAFGVSHQRISTILNHRPSSAHPSEKNFTTDVTQ